MKYTLAALSLILSSTAAMAQSTPVGLWKTFDESTKAEKSLVRISEAGGVVTGKVEKVLEAGKQDAKCDKCTDERSSRA